MRQQHSFEDINFKGKNTAPSIHAIPDQVVVAHPPSDVVVAANTATAYFLDTLKRTDNVVNGNSHLHLKYALY